MTFFFFQAEDGIRDIGVTGVQTCALPILFLFPLILRICLGRLPARWVDPHHHSRLKFGYMPQCFFGGTAVKGERRTRDRSEERRVGKEGRSRWSPYHLKKKNTTIGRCELS